ANIKQAKLIPQRAIYFERRSPLRMGATRLQQSLWSHDVALGSDDDAGGPSAVTRVETNGEFAVRESGPSDDGLPSSRRDGNGDAADDVSARPPEAALGCSTSQLSANAMRASAFAASLAALPGPAFSPRRMPACARQSRNSTA
ncbi:MAG: hypothetical protein WCB02_15920, partial [Bradyrhizobium sp.]